MEDELFKVKCKLLLDLEDIYIHIKYIPVEFGFFLNASETLSFQVIGMVQNVVFQKLRKKLDCIKRTAPHMQETPTNKTHLHNHQTKS